MPGPMKEPFHPLQGADVWLNTWESPANIMTWIWGCLRRALDVPNRRHAMIKKNTAGEQGLGTVFQKVTGWKAMQPPLFPQHLSGAVVRGFLHLPHLHLYPSASPGPPHQHPHICISHLPHQHLPPCLPSAPPDLHPPHPRRLHPPICSICNPAICKPGWARPGSRWEGHPSQWCSPFIAGCWGAIPREKCEILPSSPCHPACPCRGKSTSSPCPMQLLQQGSTAMLTHEQRNGGRRKFPARGELWWG